VVSPASLPIETQGTLTACDRRMQANMKVFGSKAGMENWEIIADMALKIGGPRASSQRKTFKRKNAE